MLPAWNKTPPFNITRASHVVLGSRDLGAARDFYTRVIGLVLTEETPDCLYLRGLEEATHHSLVIRLAGTETPACECIGFRVSDDEEIEKARHFLDRQDLAIEQCEVPYQGRTIRFIDPAGARIELCASMDVVPRRVQEFHRFRGGSPQRLDHFQVATHDVRCASEFYCDLGFRVAEYTAAEASNDLWGTWLERKGNTHDLVFTNGRGPRLHHFAYTTPDAQTLIHACDVSGSLQAGDIIDRGPGRHGISNALFVYFRDPDQHRIELFTTHYQFIDVEAPPIRWEITDPRRSQLWGLPASRRWFFEASPFEGCPVREPLLAADPPTLEAYLARA
ncbi:3,4-dihydroxyphenylacetate 2,3-dioxygenase [Bradyrhizobium tropiciagri]|uniref:3,4-dihydroxyphenylacetate 2,3-dioxygenase n=1 Tax=Bradyrhizobium tropiciagri TaxID=312253 RepID=UPI00067C0D83|nr:3,4-dihydroxyphenylacetate 2,3-dioxygenase [Bradyrhizobium tropiciagri]